MEQFARKVARQYALDAHEDGDFLASWALSQRLTQRVEESEPEELRTSDHREAYVEVFRGFQRLKSAVDGKPSTKLGHRHVRWEPLANKKYVIFSDHHIMHRGHRHNFFASSGNLWIYAAALAQYYDAGYTLVENGDVEDLVVYEPKLEPNEPQRRVELTLDQLSDRRLVVRHRQLRRIYEDPQNRPWVEAIQRFDEQQRLIRVAGNHDYDLQRDGFAEELARHLPNLKLPSDYLLLYDDSETGKRARYAIMHGHQFDMATNPVSAPRHGETISECLGLYFQGPDRIWRWHDEVAAWATGARPMSNFLSRDNPPNWGTKMEIPQPGDPNAARRLFQKLFHHTIAWEYFHSAHDPVKALQFEVLNGERWFKFRHMDESMIARRMEEVFPDPAERPVLVLGHSHEPRIRSAYHDREEVCDHYLNSAAAGRFENLLWAIEIIDGQAQVVSWSCLPPPNGPVERRTWHAEGLASLRAAATPQGVP